MVHTSSLTAQCVMPGAELAPCMNSLSPQGMCTPAVCALGAGGGDIEGQDTHHVEDSGGEQRNGQVVG